MGDAGSSVTYFQESVEFLSKLPAADLEVKISPSVGACYCKRDFTLLILILLEFFPNRSCIRFLFHLIKLEISNIMMRIWKLQDPTISVLLMCDVMPSNIIPVFHPRSASISFFPSACHLCQYYHVSCFMTWRTEDLWYILWLRGGVLYSNMRGHDLPVLRIFMTICIILCMLAFLMQA